MLSFTEFLKKRAITNGHPLDESMNRLQYAQYKAEYYAYCARNSGDTQTTSKPRED